MSGVLLSLLFPKSSLYGLGSSCWVLCTQYLCVPGLDCVCDNALSWICMRLYLHRAVAPQPLQQYVSSPLVWKGIKDPERLCIEVWDLCICFKVVSVSFWQCNSCLTIVYFSEVLNSGVYLSFQTLTSSCNSFIEFWNVTHKMLLH